MLLRLFGERLFHLHLNLRIPHTRVRQRMLYATTEVMQASYAYTLSSTVVLLLCIWTLFQGSCVSVGPIWSALQFVHYPWGFVTRHPQVWILAFRRLSGALHRKSAVSWDLQGLFLLDLAIDFLLKLIYLLLQLTNEIHYSLPDAVGEKKIERNV